MKCWHLGCVGLAVFFLAAVCRIQQSDTRQEEPPTFHRLSCHDAVHCLAFSPDGKTLAAGSGVPSQTGEIKLWDLASPRQPRTLSGHTNAIVSLAFAPDSLTLGTASYDSVKLWDLAARQPIGTQQEDFGPARCGCLAFRPDLKQLAIAVSFDSGPTLRLGSIPASDTSFVLDCPEFIAALAFSADGRLLAAGGVKQGVYIYDSRTGVQLLKLRGESSVSAVAFTPDGQSLAVGDVLGRVWLWDLTTAQVRATWVGHDAHFIYGLAFSPDGRLLATGSSAGSVKLWDARAGTERAHYQEHTDAVTAVAFSPDGYWLASGSLDTTLGLRRLSPPH
jgi:WD40 repeat protein